MAIQKVLIADDDAGNANNTKAFLNEHGFEARVVSNGQDAIRLVAEWKPQFVIIELLLPRVNAIQFLQEISQVGFIEPIKVFVISNHSDRRNIKRCIDLGAIDYIIKPFSNLDLLTRLLFHCNGLQDVSARPEVEFNDQSADKRIHLIDLMLKHAGTPQTRKDFLFKTTNVLAKQLKAVRCNVVRIEESLPTQGTVITSSDDESLPEIKINLNKYPEITYSHRTGKTVAIENVDKDATLAQIKKHLESVYFNSLIVCPLFVDSKAYGVLTVKFPEERKTISDADLQFVKVVCQITGLALSNPIQVYESTQKAS